MQNLRHPDTTLGVSGEPATLLRRSCGSGRRVSLARRRARRPGRPRTRRSRSPTRPAGRGPRVARSRPWRTRIEGRLHAAVAQRDYSGVRPVTTGAVACTDTDPRRAEAFAARHGVPHVAPPQLLDPADIDLAVILTPPQQHVPAARSLIAAGIAVHIEKPLALRADDAHALLAEAAAGEVIIGAAPDTPLAAPTQTALAAINDGAIGEIVAASAAYCASGPE